MPESEKPYDCAAHLAAIHLPKNTARAVQQVKKDYVFYFAWLFNLAKLSKKTILVPSYR
jgi:hypothetical protein